MLCSSLPAGHQVQGHQLVVGKRRTELAFTGRPQRRARVFSQQVLSSSASTRNWRRAEWNYPRGSLYPKAKLNRLATVLPGSYLLMARTADTAGSMQPMDLGPG